MDRKELLEINKLLSDDLRLNLANSIITTTNQLVNAGLEKSDVIDYISHIVNSTKVKTNKENAFGDSSEQLAFFNH